jgi:hypothetical protein
MTKEKRAGGMAQEYLLSKFKSLGSESQYHKKKKLKNIPRNLHETWENTDRHMA